MTTTATTKVTLLGGGRHCQVSSQIGPLKTSSHSHAWQIGINSRRLGGPGKRVTVSLRNSLAQHVLPAAQRVSAVLGVAPACAGSRYRSGRGCVGIYVVEGPAVPPRQPRESRVAQELPLGNELLTREFTSFLGRVAADATGVYVLEDNGQRVLRKLEAPDCGPSSQSILRIL